MDCFDGRHPNVFVPSEMPHDEFRSIEDINNYLLQHKAVVDLIRRKGGKPRFVFLMFDEQTEALVRELGGEMWFPKARLRTRMDNKIETVRVGNKAGVPSVPNTLGELNPRITGASSMTNHAAFAHADAPLFLFHLLEFSKKPFTLDVEELNARWADPDMIDSWSQMVIKHTDDSVDIITHAPQSGIYKMLEDGRVVFDRFAQEKLHVLVPERA